MLKKIIESEKRERMVYTFVVIVLFKSFFMKKHSYMTTVILMFYNRVLYTYLKNVSMMMLSRG